MTKSDNFSLKTHQPIFFKSKARGFSLTWDSPVEFSVKRALFELRTLQTETGKTDENERVLGLQNGYIHL